MDAFSNGVTFRPDRQPPRFHAFFGAVHRKDYSNAEKEERCPRPISFSHKNGVMKCPYRFISENTPKDPLATLQRLCSTPS